MLYDMTVQDFTNLTASAAPAPGGGSIAALAGALAMALGQMVANLTLGKEKYREQWYMMQGCADRLQKAQQDLLNAVDADSRAFDQYMAALAMPKTTDEEIAARKAAMQEGLKAAVAVPLEVAKRLCELMPTLSTLLDFGNPNAVTDGLVAIMMARTGILGAVYNARVNLASITDQHFVRWQEEACDYYQRQALIREWEALSRQSIARPDIIDLVAKGFSN